MRACVWTGRAYFVTDRVTARNTTISGRPVVCLYGPGIAFWASIASIGSCLLAAAALRRGDRWCTSDKRTAPAARTPLATSATAAPQQKPSGESRMLAIASAPAPTSPRSSSPPTRRRGERLGFSDQLVRHVLSFPLLYSVCFRVMPIRYSETQLETRRQWWRGSIAPGGSPFPSPS